MPEEGWPIDLTGPEYHLFSLFSNDVWWDKKDIEESVENFLKTI
jgi:hypothetical protein